LPGEVHEVEAKVVGFSERVQIDIVVLKQVVTAERPQSCHDGGGCLIDLLESNIRLAKRLNR